MAEDSKKDAPKTLTDEDIETSKGRDVGRRKMVMGVGAASAIVLATGCRPRARVVQVQTVQAGITDSDSGPCADPGGGGRGNSGITDADGGQCADPAGRGRGGVQVQQVQPTSGITDSDGGQYADPAGNGRGVVQTGITDSDSGPCSDPGGGGRGYSGLTDSDGGQCSDPGGRGRTGY